MAQGWSDCQYQTQLNELLSVEQAVSCCLIEQVKFLGEEVKPLDRCCYRRTVSLDPFQMVVELEADCCFGYPVYCRVVGVLLAVGDCLVLPYLAGVQQIGEQVENCYFVTA